MDDDAFDQFITYDEGSDSEKENATPRQPKTNQNQFDMIASFMKCNNEDLVGKAIFEQLWDNLAANLNDIGPPEHTVVEWKKIWSSHKYYKNRKRLTNTSLRSDKPGKASRLDQSSQLSVVVEDVGIGAADTNEMVPIQSQFLDKLDVVIANRNTMITNQNVIVAEMKNLVQVISKKA